MQKPLQLSDKDFVRFQKFLNRESGLNFDGERKCLLQSALYERLLKQGCSTYSEYYELLNSPLAKSKEIKELFDLITVGETSFFRNTSQFNVLRTTILPEIIKRKISGNNCALSVWSAGCSRGAEAYSIAMDIVEQVPKDRHWKISVLGTDINRDVLCKAKEGVYTKQEIELVPAAYLKKYFYYDKEHYVIKDDIKKIVTFKYENLVEGPFFRSEVHGFDIIFCRNVTIYFDVKTTKQVIGNLYNCLKTNGYLFIGHSESLFQINKNFKRIDFPDTIVYKKVLPVEKEKKTEEKLSFISIPKMKPQKPLRLTKEKPPVAEQIDISSSFATALSLANQAKYDDAVKLLKKIIEQDNLYVEAYYLLGVILYKLNDIHGAEIQFRKVIYIDQKLIAPFFNLGNICLYMKQPEKAAREFKNAIALLQEKDKNDPVRFYEDYNCEFMLRICKNKLEEIKLYYST